MDTLANDEYAVPYLTKNAMASIFNNIQKAKADPSVDFNVVSPLVDAAVQLRNQILKPMKN